MQRCSSSKNQEMMGLGLEEASCKGPKGGIGKAVMRRRSRASKKTPTTLLKADAKNFRALVHQFTGCHTATPLLRPYKGPINLNFKHSTYYPQKQQQQEEISDDDRRRFSFPSAAAKYNAAHDDELFLSRAVQQDHQNPRSADDALTHDPSDVDNFWGQVLSASAADHYFSTGPINHEFWG